MKYASNASRKTLKSYNIVQSISRFKTCWNDALSERFFKSLKTELIYGTKLVGAKQMKNKIFDYIEIWYRKQKRHSYLIFQTIEEFNNQYLKQNVNNVA